MYFVFFYLKAHILFCLFDIPDLVVLYLCFLIKSHTILIMLICIWISYQYTAITKHTTPISTRYTQGAPLLNLDTHTHTHPHTHAHTYTYRQRLQIVIAAIGVISD